MLFYFFSNKVSDKTMFNKLINFNLVLHSNSKSECGICYEDVNEVKELYKNLP